MKSNSNWLSMEIVIYPVAIKDFPLAIGRCRWIRMPRLPTRLPTFIGLQTQSQSKWIDKKKITFNIIQYQLCCLIQFNSIRLSLFIQLFDLIYLIIWFDLFNYLINYHEFHLFNIHCWLKTLIYLTINLNLY